MNNTAMQSSRSLQRMVRPHGYEVTAADYQLMRFRCEWCRNVFERSLPFGRGRYPKFCCNAHRQIAFYWKFKKTHGVRYKMRSNDKISEPGAEK